MKIASVTAPNPGAFTLDGTKTYIVGDSIVIDPGPAIESHIAAVLAAAPRLESIFITHRHDDHAPAAERLRLTTGARVFAPRDVLSDEVVDQRITGGERIEAGGTTIEVIATPGHTKEHVCFLTPDGDLFTGDTILGVGTTAIFPPDGHMGDYIASLGKLLALRPSRIYPAHGPVRDDAVELIGEYLTHRLLREKEVLAAVVAGDQMIAQMRARIYPTLDGSLHRAAEIQLWAHLIKLVEERRLVEREGKYEEVRSKK